MVLGRHIPSSGLGGWLQAWQRGGWTGVDLFFVLSGFLVSGLLFDEHRRTGTIHGARFLVRRGLKIYPAFWALLAISVYVWHQGGWTYEWRQLVHELLFVQNYAQGLWAHTWSLAVEEHFYFGLTALVSVLWLNRRQHFLPPVFWGIAAICLGLRLWTLSREPGFTFEANMFPTHLRIDSLFYGVFLAFLTRYRVTPFSRWPAPVLLILGAACFAPFFLRELSPLAIVVGATPLYIGGGFLVMAASRLSMSSSTVLIGLAELGKASYSIYLWHMPVALWVVPSVGGGFWLKLGVYVLGSISLGLGMNAIIERPILAARDRWFPQNA
jgi:peptidoglycan/LPS O-acetylase OafA/YrhL